MAGATTVDQKAANHDLRKCKSMKTVVTQGTSRHWLT